MKKIYLILLLSGATHFLFAQSGQWVWLRGSNIPGSLSNYGTQGVPSATNDPGCTYESCQWTDLNGDFWMFGGMDSSGSRNSDIWKYHPGTNMWTWMNGPGFLDDAFGTYGTMGIASPLNSPPCVSHGTTTWVDLQGNLWMFGGYTGFDSFSDLWKYDISTNEWTWVAGPGFSGDPGTYGTLGVPNTANNPCSRAECAAAWTDANGDLWLFGGQNAMTGGMLNDLWRYNIASNMWTWMNGSQFLDQPGVYGTLGVENAANTPGARGSYSHWKDNNGNFWLFGGVDFTNSQSFNDLWRYNPSTGNWAWINGPSVGNDGGIYGSKCQVASSNNPPARFESRACWTDPNGNFWFYGGFYGDPSFNNVSNDLWMYCVSKNEWIWESNDNNPDPAGNWGTMGVSSPTNKPDGRGGSVGWTDGAGHLYFFGGATQVFPNPLNDLWEYTIDPLCSSCSATVLPPVAALESSDSTICTYDCINFTDLSTGATSWQWSFQGGNPTSSTAENPQNICYLSSGNFQVTLIASNSGGSDTLSFNSFIHVISSPPTPTITQSGDTLICSTDPSYTSYQWYADTTLIPGATGTSIIATHDGNYNVKVSNENGCSIAVGINVTLNGLKDYSLGNPVSISPNPSTGKITLHISPQLANRSTFLTVVNALGQLIYESQIINDRSEIDLSEFAAGIYFVRVVNENNKWIGKIVKD